MKEKHLKMTVQPDGTSKVLEAVAFNQAEGFVAGVPPLVRLVYRPDVNRFRGLESLQLIVEHMEPCEPGLAD